MSYNNNSTKKRKIIIATVIPVVIFVILIISLVLGLTIKKLEQKTKPFVTEDLNSIFDRKYFNLKNDVIFFTIAEKQQLSDLIVTNSFSNVTFSFSKNDKKINDKVSIYSLLNYEHSSDIKIVISARKEKVNYMQSFNYKVNLSGQLAVFEFSDAVDQDVVFDLIPRSLIERNHPNFIFEYFRKKTINNEGNFVTSGYDKFKTLELFEDSDRIKRVSSLADISRCYLTKVREDESSHDSKLVKVYYQDFLNDDTNFSFQKDRDYFYCHPGENLNYLARNLESMVDISKNHKSHYFDKIKWYLYSPSNNRVIEEINLKRFLISQSSYLINQQQKKFILDKTVSSAEDNNYTIYYFEIYIVPEAELKKLDIVYDLGENNYEIETKNIENGQTFRNYNEGNANFLIPENYYHSYYLDENNKRYEIYEDLRNIIPNRENKTIRIGVTDVDFFKNTYIIVKPQISKYRQVIITIPHPKYCADLFEETDLALINSLLIIPKLKNYLPILYYFNNWFEETNSLPLDFGFTKEHFTSKSAHYILPNYLYHKIDPNLTVEEYFALDARLKDDNTGFIHLVPTNHNQVIFETVYLIDSVTHTNYLILDAEKSYNLKDPKLGFVKDGYYFTDKAFQLSLTNLRSNTFSFEYFPQSIFIQLHYFVEENNILKQLSLYDKNTYNSQAEYKVNSNIDASKLLENPEYYIDLPITSDFKGIENLFYQKDFNNEHKVEASFKATWDKIATFDYKQLSEENIAIYFYFKAIPLRGQLKVNVLLQTRDLDTYTFHCEKTMNVIASQKDIDFNYNDPVYIDIVDEMDNNGFVEASSKPSIKFYFNRDNPYPSVEVKFNRKNVSVLFYHKKGLNKSYETQLKHDMSFRDAKLTSVFDEIKNILGSVGLDIDLNTKLIIHINDDENIILKFHEFLDYRFRAINKQYNIDVDV